MTRKKNAVSVWTRERTICQIAESDHEGDFLSVFAHCVIALLNDLTAVAAAAAVDTAVDTAAVFEGTA